MQIKTLVMSGLLILLLGSLWAALPWYDTDETQAAVLAKYAVDLDGQKACAADQDKSWGMRAVSFGTVATTCRATFFVVLNRFPWQTSGDPVPLRK